MYELMCRVNTLCFGGRLNTNQSGVVLNEVDLEQLRAEIRAQLDGTREALSNQFSERTVYRLLFGFTVFFDECVLTSRADAHLKWQTLQSELYETDEGGLLFYETIDELLEEEHPSFVYEAFYFCLRLGFLGKLAGQPKRVNAYMNALSARFKQPDQSTVETPGTDAKVFKLHAYQWYYAVAISCNVALWAVMRFA